MFSWLSTKMVLT